MREMKLLFPFLLFLVFRNYKSCPTPVFCDVDPITWNMNIDNVKRVTTKKTKGVLMVHTYGLPADATNIKFLR